MKMQFTLAAIAAASAIGALAALSSAAIIQVDINGDVYGNAINSGTLSGVSVGETATVSFLLDSDDFVNSPNFPTRGYTIDLSSFVINFSGGTSIGLAPSFAGPAYFVLRDNDPAVDGFFLSFGTDFPNPLPLNQQGLFGQFGIEFSVGYVGSLLNSLDILDAIGDYDFSGLTNFAMGINDGPFEGVLGIDFA